MKTFVLVLFFGLALSTEAVEAQSPEASPTKCQQLALDFGKDPDALTAEHLQQLRFCITQTLNDREAKNPPAMLKGTIIDPLTSSDTGASPSPSSLNSND